TAADQASLAWQRLAPHLLRILRDAEELRERQLLPFGWQHPSPHCGARDEHEYHLHQKPLGSGYPTRRALPSRHLAREMHAFYPKESTFASDNTCLPGRVRRC